MAGKYVVRNPKVILDPNGAAVDVSKWFKSFSPGFSVVEIETMGLGDVGDATEKGSTKDSLKVEFFHSANWTEWSKLILDELRKTGDTVFLFKDDSGTVDDDHPSFEIAVKVVNIGDLFGGKNTAPTGNVTWRVQGQIKITYAGAVVVYA